jgi:hypothetical protein
MSPRLLLLGARSPPSPSPARLMTSTPENARKMLPSVIRLRGCLSSIIEKKYAKKAELAYIAVTSNALVKSIATNHDSAGKEINHVNPAILIVHFQAIPDQGV